MLIICIYCYHHIYFNIFLLCLISTKKSDIQTHLFSIVQFILKIKSDLWLPPKLKYMRTFWTIFFK